MTQSPLIRVVGEVMVDVLARTSTAPAPGSDAPASISDEEGGSGANLAAWLADLHVPVELVARVGDDSRGAAALDVLDAAGVTLRVARDPERATGRCVVIVTPDGERTMFPDPGANARLAVSDLDGLPWRAGDHLHVSGYSLLRQGSRAAALTALERARAAALSVSVDASSHALLLALGPEAFLAWLAPGDLLLANADEAAALSGHSDPLDSLRALTARDLLVVVKRGPDGAVVGKGDQRWSAPAEPAENRDTTGAGDAFAAGFLASWTRGADIEEALRLATRVAARAVSSQGGRP
jgi:sugar/nucleoside kinase (ribokinase family)